MIQTLLARLKSSPVTTALIAVNVLVFLAAERSGSTTETATLLKFGAVSRPQVWGGEPWRMVTAMFLHIGAIHLVWNAYAGFSFCAQAEKLLGRGWFLAVYLLSGLAGSAVSVIAQDVVSAGASGALFGVIGVDFAFHYRRLGSVKAFFDDPTVRRQLVNLAVWFVIGLTALRMDNWAHGGGLFGGLLLTLALTSARGTPVRVGAIAVIALLTLLALRPLPIIHRAAAATLAAAAALDRDPAEAVRLTEGILEPKALQLRAGALLTLERYREAEDTASVLIARSPVDTGALYLRGRARLAQKDYAGAIDDFDRSIAITPAFAWSYYLRGTAHHALGQLDRARSDAEAATRRDQTFCEAWWLRGVVAEPPDEKVSHYTKALSVCGPIGQVALLLNRANAQLEAGHIAEAAKDNAEAIRLAPRDAGLHYQRCVIEQRRPDPAAAEVACTEALAIEADHVPARRARAELRLSAGRFSDAVVDFDALLFADAEDAAARLGRGNAQLGAGDLDAALTDAETLVASGGALEADALLLRARIRLRRGERKLAQADLTAALAAGGDDWAAQAEARALMR